jgi:hypothetical protein
LTTLTEGQRTCERDSGILKRDCYCAACEDLQQEWYELHRDLASAQLSAGPEEAKEARMLAICKEIERYRQWL